MLKFLLTGLSVYNPHGMPENAKHPINSHQFPITNSKKNIKKRKSPKKHVPSISHQFPITKSMSHRIHGAAIYGNMNPINIPPLC